jgi:hypothetical protein
VYYLPPRAFKALLGAISETAVVGSRLYFDFINLTTMSGAGARSGRGRAGCGGRGGGFSRGQGWWQGRASHFDLLDSNANLSPPPFPLPPAGEVFHPGFETLMVSVWNKGEYFLSGVDERKEVS